MLRRRLYLQIYLTIVASLVLVVVLSAVLWQITDRGRPDRDVLDLVGRLAYLSLPPDGAPAADQRAAVARLGRELNIDVSLFDGHRTLVAAHGRPLSPPRADMTGSGWHRMHGPHAWILSLPDGRWLVAGLARRGEPRRPWLNLALFLGSVALGVGLGAYPLVRRLTRRLERLQAGVEEIGAGNLSARVDVRGKDEIAALAASFNEAAGKIETLLNAHRLLLANASHELRTPLSRIRLGVEMLKDRDDPARREALQQDIAELDELIDEILMMSRLDTGTHNDPPEEVDLVALAAEECARYSDCSLSGTVAPISGDPRLLRRLIRNLLENAHVHGKPPVEVVLSRASDAVALAVSDAGPGIPEAERERVFEPFYRAPDRQNVRGYGLGLALVRQIAGVHGGTAAAAPNDRGGTTVRVVLRAQDGEAAS